MVFVIGQYVVQLEKFHGFLDFWVLDIDWSMLRSRRCCSCCRCCTGRRIVGVLNMVGVQYEKSFHHRLREPPIFAVKLQE